MARHERAENVGPGGRHRSRWVARISERIREATSEIILFELKDPRIGFVTVLSAEITPDGKQATVVISVMGPPAKQKLTMHAIESARGYIQRELGRRLRTRETPALHFQLDEKTEKVRSLEETLDRLRQERLVREGAADGPEGPDAAPDEGDEPPDDEGDRGEGEGPTSA